MAKFLIPILLLLFNSACYTTQADNGIYDKVEEYFVKKEWDKASDIYNHLLCNDIYNIELYARAIVTAVKCDNYNRVMEYIIISENRGIPLDSIFNRALTLSLKIRETEVYENILLTIKKEQPWLNDLINSYLLKFYYVRKNNFKCIEIANVIIGERPENIIEVMIIKAKALNDMGDINSAATIMRDILSIDSNNIDARLFLGHYYYILAKQGIKDGNFSVKVSEKRGRKNSNVKYMDRDIYSALKRAKYYLNIDSYNNPYIQNIIKEIEDMIKTFETPII